jgi:hypothetical protein
VQEDYMRVLVSGLVLSTLGVTAGCGGDVQATPREQDLERQLTEVVAKLEALERDRALDLALAAREADNGRVQLAELGPAARAASAPAPRPRSQPAGRPAPQPVYNPAPRPAPQPRVVTETNVKRDAAIGAGVGAVAGAVIHKPNRVKGAVVGAVIGGAAGAVVGATVDKTTRVVYD